MYDAARVVGDVIRQVDEIDRVNLERDKLRFNVHFILGGQIRGDDHELYLIYPQGNPLCSSTDAPFLQIGETKYGRPILDRGIKYDSTTLESATKYALISIDSTMRSNMTVGPPVDLLIYRKDTMKVSAQRRFAASDPELKEIHLKWEQSLRKAIIELPPIHFDGLGKRQRKHVLVSDFGFQITDRLKRVRYGSACFNLSVIRYPKSEIRHSRHAL